MGPCTVPYTERYRASWKSPTDQAHNNIRVLPLQRDIYIDELAIIRKYIVGCGSIYARRRRLKAWRSPCHCNRCHQIYNLTRGFESWCRCKTWSRMGWWERRAEGKALTTYRMYLYKYISYVVSWCDSHIQKIFGNLKAVFRGLYS